MCSSFGSIISSSPSKSLLLFHVSRALAISSSSSRMNSFPDSNVSSGRARLAGVIGRGVRAVYFLSLGPDGCRSRLCAVGPPAARRRVNVRGPTLAGVRLE